MNENFNYCHVVGKTDIGRRRAANEDNMCNAVTQNGLVSIVCDGMGGHVGGATASRIAVTAIIDNLNNVFYDDPRIAIGESIDRANQAILQKAIEQPELAGMGSTCVMLLVREGKVYIGHVGDSRIYLVRSKTIVQLTKDHSYVQMLVDCGEITKEQAEHHPRKNEITNALGIPNMSPATVADDAIIPEAGDCFVLCSDGLSGMVSDDAICKVISRQSEMNAQERVDKLVALANANGGIDNITVQLVEFAVSPNAVTSGKRGFSKTKITLLVLAVLLMLGGAGVYWRQQKEALTGEISKTPPAGNGSAKCDTITKFLGKIKFEKGKEIVELVFNDSTLELRRGEDKLYSEQNVSFKPASLQMSVGITAEYNNSLLRFTDINPGDSVIFSLTTSDQRHVYRYKFEVTDGNDDSGSKEVATAVQPEDDNKGTELKVAKTDTVSIQFEYTELAKGAKLLLNYSAKPKIIFNAAEKPVGQNLIEPQINEITMDDLYWKMEHNAQNCQLAFVFQGESSKDKHTFSISCVEKESNKQLLIMIELSFKESELDGGSSGIDSAFNQSA